jgi:hypothetical protein
LEWVQALSEVRSENLEQAMARLKEVEGALCTALDEVESESLQSTKLLDARDDEAVRMRAMVAANAAEISRMASELDAARNQLQEAAQAADDAQVQSPPCGCCGTVLHAWRRARRPAAACGLGDAAGVLVHPCKLHCVTARRAACVCAA